MSDAQRVLRRAALLSVVVGLVILVIKVAAYVLTGSAAILSDAIESVVHVLATLVLLGTLRYSQQPPDRHHPYGHGNATAFSVGFEGGLVALSGVLVLVAVVDRLIHGSELTELSMGLLWTFVAGGINTALGLYLLMIGRRHRSDALLADGQHVLADVWTSVGVLLGLGLVQLTGWHWIDLLTASLIALHLLWVGSSLVRRGVASLMNEVEDADYEQVLQVINQQRQPDWYDVHAMRLLKMGDRVHVDFHLVVPGAWRVEQAHAVEEALEAAILTALDRPGSVIVHFDAVGEAELADTERFSVQHGAWSLNQALRSIEPVD